MSRLRGICCSQCKYYLHVVDGNAIDHYGIFSRENYEYRGRWYGRLSSAITETRNIPFTEGLKKAIKGAVYIIRGHSIQKPETS